VLRHAAANDVLRAGKTLVICESEVYAEKKSEEKLVAKTTVTLAVTGAVVSQEGNCTSYGSLG
jgi:acyl-coenzyme A thioesterase PaaI-like protein